MPPLRMSAFGVKRTYLTCAPMSAFDPKRTSAVERAVVRSGGPCRNKVASNGADQARDRSGIGTSQNCHAPGRCSVVCEKGLEVPPSGLGKHQLVQRQVNTALRSRSFSFSSSFKAKQVDLHSAILPMPSVQGHLAYTNLAVGTPPSTCPGCAEHQPAAASRRSPWACNASSPS